MSSKNAAAKNASAVAAASTTPSVTQAIKEDKDIIVIPMLKGENYSNWQNAMSAYLEYKQLWSVCVSKPVESITDEVKGPMLEAWLILSSKITPSIFNSINSNWAKLKSNYATASIYGIYRVWQGYRRVKYKDDLLTYIIRIEGALAEITTIGLDVMQQLISVDIIDQITEKRPVLMERHNQIQPIVETSAGTQTALSTTTNRTGGGVKRKIICCSGGKHNPEAPHTQDQCWTLHLELQPPRKEACANVNTIANQSLAERVDYAYHTMSDEKSKESVILDSGASQHMFNRWEYFINSKPTNVYIVTGAGKDATDMIATRQGTVRLCMSDSTTITLKNALYVQSLATNLISFVQLIKDKAEIVNHEGKMTVKLNGHHVLNIRTDNNLLQLRDVMAPSQVALVTITKPCQEDLLWHRRFGHTSAARIKVILGSKAPSENKTTPMCTVCMQGKMTKLPFSGKFSPTYQSLEVIHGNLVGPISPSRNSGFQYFLTIVNQHTGYIHVTLLKGKSNATAAIVKYKTHFEKQTGNKIKKLVTDGGGEFCNGSPHEILKSKGIQHNISPPYTPQHNGIAERANRTIIKMTRCLLLQANIAPEWWAEAIETAAATTNSLPSLSQSRAAPIKLFLKTDVNPNFLKPFGCQAWLLKPNANRDTKFDPILWEGTFLGYENDMSCYRVFRHEDKKVVSSRNVRFNKSIFPICKATHKTLSTTEDNEMPMFQAQPLMPFKEVANHHLTKLLQVGDLGKEDSCSPSHPIAPPAVEQWVYVADYQPPNVAAQQHQEMGSHNARGAHPSDERNRSPPATGANGMPRGTRSALPHRFSSPVKELSTCISHKDKKHRL
ncbi:hypothetical protein PCASD_15872 [Puccinia coronata f. sp. avenae]|uniref:Integrase catalytic domain-containing protein n=1 Tax=Puccinia coronata f. sp. avenae TaxID=200324 RepID=A0A2N5U7W6_9BASI|nr:hypothetical protein PCASD_15872 [Puccinia coronata f. sp. avenae]